MSLINAEELRYEMYHEAFETDSDLQKWDSGCWIRYKLFENVMERMPTVEQQQWIPCSERLPKEDGRYLVTCSKWGAWVVDWNIWHNEPKPSWLWEHGVIAWMPLPEPYREGDNDG